MGRSRGPPLVIRSSPSVRLRRTPPHEWGGPQAMPRPHKWGAAQALLEFALIAPMLFLLIGATVDLGRGLLIYTALQGASRDTARQAVLSYYSGSNTLAPDCTALATPCTLGPLTNRAPQLDALGMSVVYLDSGGLGAPPSYGRTRGHGPQPGTTSSTGGPRHSPRH